jgi:transposase
MATPSLYARPPADPAEERTLRKLAGARHAPASWQQRARIITGSWDGASAPRLAAELGCHPITIARWLHRFNHGGIDDLGDLPRSGRPPRLSELDRGQVIALARSTPPGRLVRQPDGTLGPAAPDDPAAVAVAHWTLDALAEPPRPPGSRSAAARSAGSWPGRACAGGRCAPGPPAPTPSSPQKGRHHRPLHHPTSANDRDLRR